MNKTITALLSLAVGFGGGFFTAYMLLNKKYIQRTEEAVASVKARYEEKKETPNANKTAEAFQNVTKSAETAVKSFNDIVNDLKYVPNTTVEPSEVRNPYLKRRDGTPETGDGFISIIPEEEYGLDLDYDQISMHYYTDNVLADDMDNDEVNVEDTVGRYALDHIDDPEYDGIIYVKNDYRKAYYEIERTQTSYAEVMRRPDIARDPSLVMEKQYAASVNSTDEEEFGTTDGDDE